MAENKDVTGRAALRQTAKKTKQTRLVAQQGPLAQSKSLASDFGGTKPKFFVSFDTYGNVRQLQEIVGNEPEQRFLIVDANGVDYDLINADSVVKQVRTYFKNNKEGLRKTLFDLGYMTERDYTTRGEQALTSGILKVANEYTVDVVDSYRIDGKTKFPTFTSWLKGIPAAGGDGGGDSQYPMRDIDMMDRDVVEAIVKDVYAKTTDMAIDDDFLKQETDRYMNQIEQGTLTTLDKKGGVNVRKTTKPFSAAQVEAELPKRIAEEKPGATDPKKSLDFLAFLDGMGAQLG
jgi:hypothetical protein